LTDLELIRIPRSKKAGPGRVDFDQSKIRGGIGADDFRVKFDAVLSLTRISSASAITWLLVTM
jgi:hypothetical protein